MAIHDFATRLADSVDARLLAKLDEVYREFYPSELVIRIVRDNSEAFQRSGCDVQVELRTPGGGPPLIHTIEEKIRSPLQSAYADLLIETHSNEERGTAGWIYTSRANWLSYVCQPPGGISVRIISMSDLKRWFIPRKDQYRVKTTQTAIGAQRYTTVNRVIPLGDRDFRLFCATHGVVERHATALIDLSEYDDLPF